MVNVNQYNSHKINTHTSLMNVYILKKVSELTNLMLLRFYSLFRVIPLGHCMGRGSACVLNVSVYACVCICAHTHNNRSTISQLSACISSYYYHEFGIEMWKLISAWLTLIILAIT